MSNYLMRWSQIIIAGIFLFSVHGCAPIPKHEMATPAGSSHCNEAVSEALASGIVIPGDGPTSAWWREFNDPKLTEIIEAALLASPTLKRAEARLKAASQFALRKRASLYPDITLDPQTNWQHFAKDGFFRSVAPTVPAVINDINFDLSYVYEFDFWGKNRDLFKAAQGLARAARAEKIQAELILTTSIAYAYAELQFLLRKQQIFKQIEHNEQKIVQIRAKRENHALDAATLQLTAHADALGITASLLQLEQQIKQEEHLIKALSGLGQDTPLHLVYQPLNPFVLSLPEKLSLDLLARRPDLMAQKERIESAAKEVGAAKTDFYPNVNIMGFIGLESLQWSTLFRSNNYSGSMNPAIHLPLFTAGRLKAQLMEKVADFNAAVFAYDELILRAAQEVASRLTDIALLQKQLEVYVLRLQTEKSKAQIAEHRFEGAVGDQISFLKAQNNVLQKELDCAQIEYGKQLSSILLIRAIGGGYHE